MNTEHRGRRNQESLPLNKRPILFSTNEDNNKAQYNL